MKLTPEQLHIQKRAKKGLTLGSILSIADTYYDPDKKIETLVCDRFIQYTNERIEGDYILDSQKICRNKIIENLGHPMNRGRISYLGRVRSRGGDEGEIEHAWVDMITYNNHEVMQQTVLERPLDFQKLVIAFLESLPDNTTTEGA